MVDPFPDLVVAVLAEGTTSGKEGLQLGRPFSQDQGAHAHIMTDLPTGGQDDLWIRFARDDGI